jgi:hypothetical protein
VVGWVGNVVQSAPHVRYSIPYLGKSYGSCVRDVTLVAICQVSTFDKELPRQLLKYIPGDQTSAYMGSIIMIYYLRLQECSINAAAWGRLGYYDD